jgi:hypothetical protein
MRSAVGRQSKPPRLAIGYRLYFTLPHKHGCCADVWVDFVAADMPNANRLTVGIMAMVAEEEGRMISARTKAALAAARKRGTRLGLIVV